MLPSVLPCSSRSPAAYGNDGEWDEGKLNPYRTFVGPELVSTMSDKRTHSSKGQEQDNTPRMLHVTLLSSYQISRNSLSHSATGHMS